MNMNSRARSTLTDLTRHQGSGRYVPAAVILGIVLGGSIFLFGVLFEIDPHGLACWTLVAIYALAAMSRMLLESTPGAASRLVKRLKSLLFSWPARRYR
jgi:hypothetical protein